MFNCNGYINYLTISSSGHYFEIYEGWFLDLYLDYRKNWKNEITHIFRGVLVE